MLTHNGFEIAGFDPAYEGLNPKIIKDYFSCQHKLLPADVIVLRHVLEHIKHPFDFLHQIAKAVDYKAKIYIEVPQLEWIVENNAFWDIFYEHCNYFSKNVLANMFTNSLTGDLFSGQYMYVLADLRDLREKPASTMDNSRFNLTPLNQAFNVCKKIISSKLKLLVWGAGAKGVTFVNILDPNEKFISALVDINPHKQNHYVGNTGHLIIAPASLEKYVGSDVIVMNNNYFDEIAKSVSIYNLRLIKLDELLSEAVL